jgi:hypothetical protein
MGFSFLVLTDKRLGDFMVIMPILVVYGIGRGIWVSYIEFI